jgi:hypothetical protein
MTQSKMDEARSISSHVEVPTDPTTAFVAFTDELDLWWVRGPINHWAGGRRRHHRAEARCTLGFTDVRGRGS